MIRCSHTHILSYKYAQDSAIGFPPAQLPDYHLSSVHLIRILFSNALGWIAHSAAGQPTGISITEFEEGLRAYDPRPIIFGARVAGSSGRHRKTVLSGCLG